MKKLRYLRCAALALFLAASLRIPCAAKDTALKSVREYTGFDDVPESAWFAGGVRTCYETGLMNGTSDTAFSPGGELSMAELEVLAARLHWRRAGKSGDVPSAPADTGSLVYFLADGTAVEGIWGTASDWNAMTVEIDVDAAAFPSPLPQTITAKVDGKYGLTGRYDPDGSRPGQWGRYVFSVSEEAYTRCDPLVRAALGSDYVDDWFWGADLYLKSLPGTMKFQCGFSPELPATREDFAQFLAFVLPREPSINQIQSAPDLTTADTEILQLYNAGILTGTDSYGTFRKAQTLTRGEAAVMLARAADPAARVRFTPEAPDWYLDYSLEKLPDSYEAAVRDACYLATWSDLTLVQDPSWNVSFLRSDGSLISDRDLPKDFVGRTYLEGMLASPLSPAYPLSSILTAPERQGLSARLTLPYVEGVAPIQFYDGLCGYYRQGGTILIPPTFSYAGALAEGTAIVSLEDGGYYRLTVEES